MKKTIYSLLLAICFSTSIGCQKIHVKKNHMMKFFFGSCGSTPGYSCNSIGVVIDTLCTCSCTRCLKRTSHVLRIQATAFDQCRTSCHKDTPKRCSLCLTATVCCCFNPLCGYFPFPIHDNKEKLVNSTDKLEIRIKDSALNPTEYFVCCECYQYWTGTYKKDWKYDYKQLPDFKNQVTLEATEPLPGEE